MDYQKPENMKVQNSNRENFTSMFLTEYKDYTPI